MSKVVGERFRRVDAYDKATGRAKYVGDMRLPGMLYAGVVRSSVAHGKLLAIDDSRALALPGVKAVFTAKDIPGKVLYGAPYEDHPILADDRVRFIGDPIAIVVAESPQLVRHAVKLVAVEYEELPAVLSLEEAMEPGAPLVHPNGNLIEEHHVVKGSVEAGFEQAAYVIDGEYKTDWQEHAAIEPDGALAFVGDDGTMTVYSPSQNPFSVRSVVAQTLGLPPDAVRILQPPIGGSFGGKNDYVYQLSAQAALAAWHLRQPVSLIIDREESIATGNKRHPMTIRHRTGVTEDGRICASDVTLLADGGAYAVTSPFVMWRAVTHACGAYDVPNVRVRGAVYYSHQVPAGSMRAFGSVQAIFAVERHMDKIARVLGMSPVELRRRNLLRTGTCTMTGDELTDSVGLGAALDRALELSEYDERCALIEEQSATNPRQRKGIGLALSHYGVSLGAEEGRDYAGATAEVTQNGQVVCETGVTDLGTGTLTSYTQIAAETLGLPSDDILVHAVDTAISPDSNKTVASRGTFVGGMALHKAALQLREYIEEVAAQRLNIERKHVHSVDGTFFDRRAPEETGVTLAELAVWAHQRGMPLRAEVLHELPPLEWQFELGQGEAYYCYGFSAHVAEVTVDEDTGKVTIDRVTAVIDTGRTVNPDAVLGQIYGGAVMGSGYAVLEEIGLEAGCVGNQNFDEYLLLTAADIGEIRADWVEAPAAQGPFGAKGIAELVVVGVTPAVLNAINHAKGSDISEVPANLERVFLGYALRKH